MFARCLPEVSEHLTLLQQSQLLLHSFSSKVLKLKLHRPVPNKAIGGPAFVLWARTGGTNS